MESIRDVSNRVLQDDVKASAIQQHIREIATALIVPGVPSIGIRKWVDNVVAIIRAKAEEQKTIYPARQLESNAEVACNLLDRWGALGQFGRIISSETSQLLSEIITRQSGWIANHLVAIIPDVAYWYTVLALST